MPPDCRKEGLIFKKFLGVGPQIPPPLPTFHHPLPPIGTRYPSHTLPVYGIATG